MRREDRVFAWLAALSGVLMLANAICEQYDWWPSIFKATLTFSRGNVIGLFGLVVAGLGLTYMGHLRNKSPKFLDQSGFVHHYNPVKDVEHIAGAWRVRPLGGIEADVYTLAGTDMSIVYHEDSVVYSGNNGHVMASGKPVPIGALPREAAATIRDFDLPQHHIHFCDAPNHFKTRREGVAEKLVDLQGKRAAQDYENRALREALHTTGMAHRFTQKAVDRAMGHHPVRGALQKLGLARQPSPTDQGQDEGYDRGPTNG